MLRFWFLYLLILNLKDVRKHCLCFLDVLILKLFTFTNLKDLDFGPKRTSRYGEQKTSPIPRGYGRWLSVALKQNGACYTIYAKPGCA